MGSGHGQLVFDQRLEAGFTLGKNKKKRYGVIKGGIDKSSRSLPFAIFWVLGVGDQGFASPAALPLRSDLLPLTALGSEFFAGSMAQ